jgi:hypothetical protein
VVLRALREQPAPSVNLTDKKVQPAMDLFKKLPSYQKAPPGLEREILRWIPRVFLVGTTLIILPSIITRAWNLDQDPWLVSKLITTIDISTFSLLTALWTTLFTIGLGALSVMIMKDPASVADAYPLPDAQQPRAVHEDDEELAPRYSDSHVPRPVDLKKP